MSGPPGVRWATPAQAGQCVGHLVIFTNIIIHLGWATKWATEA